MIPKIIHYVWVGRNPKSPLIEECIATWRKKLPDYQIIEWNEDNFDMHENRYIEQAYAAKKWAFVSDYIRARAIDEQGGIYLDTDVRVVDKLDPLLNHQAFIGFENQDYLSAAIFGAEKGHPLMKDILDYYQDRDFEFDQNNQMAGVNSLSVTDILKKNYGLKTGNIEQELRTGIHVYPDGVLCNPSAESKTIHLFTGSWMNGKHSWKQKLVLNIKRHLSTPKQAGLYQKLIR
ncbi:MULTISPECIES: glycosyltransferase family 32 protein [Lactobacillus]|uniref:Glycosyl transferase n=1 Tax=Lactobacillus xujianguonis TaxID=2495899 RepID=A0A437SUG4_9LACO|nr:MULTISPECIES: glycosyltransferase [Lactobacillus]RVU70534.1 glycosyl transferase [Lactobacillus xujianguonis]RVU77031.1 glycosyl transferase [Lactobacillus xujianguonis]